MHRLDLRSSKREQRKKKKKKKPSHSESALDLKALEDKLRATYYDPKHVASFSTPYVLYKSIKPSFPNVTVQDVETWLSHQKAYALHKKVNEKFYRRKVIVRGPGLQYQADLMDMSKLSGYNKRTKYLLTVIDCFSRYATAVPVPNKKGKTIVTALKTAFSQMKDGVPLKLQTDQGNEFRNEHALRYYAANKIIFFHASVHKHKAQIVERFNRTLRERINKWMTANDSKRYRDSLSDILSGYNHRKHSTFKYKYAPVEVNQHNKKKVFDLIYGDYIKARPVRYHFQVGDRVLVANLKKSNNLGKRTQTFGETIYEIYDRLPTVPPQYLVRHAQTKNEQKWPFYASELHVLRGQKSLDEMEKE